MFLQVIAKLFLFLYLRLKRKIVTSLHVNLSVVYVSKMYRWTNREVFLDDKLTGNLEILLLH